MDNPTKYLSETFAAYRKMLISSQIPPEKIPEETTSLENNVAALVVSSILFFIARSIVGTRGDLFEVAALNLGLVIGVIGTIMLVQTVGLVICRDTAYGASRVDQWGTFFVFVWTFSLVALVADHLLMTLSWTRGVHSLAGQLTNGDDVVTRIVSSAVYSLLAVGLLTFKSQRQSPGFHPGRYFLAAIIGVCTNTALLYFFVFRLRDL